ncbi:MAG: hypothetical protein KJO82_01865 [Gammaproteobacteria bacterium]|nr:hypothetical protein [Gammaproteobacteria bacterium]
MSHQLNRLKRLTALALLPLIVLACRETAAHGGVVEEDDLCVIKISYLKAHFKIYQPRIDGHEEYCEDLPNASESVFVMEYLHDELKTLPIDFRIIRNVTGKGRFARIEDIADIEDIDGVTVYYAAPRIEPDVYTELFDFTEEGDYIGIVSARPGTNQREHIAVFPFEVGFSGLGYWPLIAVLLLAIQLHYLFMSGRIEKWRASRRIREPQLTVLRGGRDSDE